MKHELGQPLPTALRGSSSKVCVCICVCVSLVKCLVVGTKKNIFRHRFWFGFWIRITDRSELGLGVRLGIDLSWFMSEYEVGERHHL